MCSSLKESILPNNTIWVTQMGISYISYKLSALNWVNSQKIIHLFFRGSIKWPINWDGASKAAEKADVIICFGSSLKVLRRYPWLWCMDRPKKHRPKLYIVNLQWTPKDSAATCKLNGRCDDVMRRVMVST